MPRTLASCGILTVLLLVPAAPPAAALGCSDVPPVLPVDCPPVRNDAFVHVTRDGYGAVCTGLYFDEQDEEHQAYGVCAGKGVIEPGHPLNCVVYVYLQGGTKRCLP